jgi:glutathione reductase (NADPH)
MVPRTTTGKRDMANHTYDVVIIGGGNGGMGVTVPTRHAGLKVAMVEAWQMGGTCPNRGCTPKKILVAAAHALDEISRAGEHHIEVGPAKLDWAGLIDREKHMIAHIPGSLSGAMQRRGVHVVHGHGHFVTPNAIKAGGHIYEAEHIVIATGSKPRPLAFPGAELMITSDDVLSDRQQPRDVVFIGGGVIAFEFSHVYARAGTRVTILQAGGRFLNRHDTDAVDHVVAVTRRIGVDVRGGIDVKRVEPAGDRLRVVFEEDGMERTIEADKIINGAGRVANTDGLDLESGQVAIDHGRLPHDDHLRSTSNKAVWIVGDALPDAPQLSPLATYEGRLVGQNIAEGPKHKPDYSSVPACLYTIPTLSSVGIDEEDAREQGLDVHIAVNDMHEWLSGRTFNEPLAWSKVISERATGRILGAHIIGHGGEELVHTFAFAMRHGITTAGFADMVYAFPTFAADMRYMV